MIGIIYKWVNTILLRRIRCHLFDDQNINISNDEENNDASFNINWSVPHVAPWLTKEIIKTTTTI